jgi:hypothetical protein
MRPRATFTKPGYRAEAEKEGRFVVATISLRRRCCAAGQMRSGTGVPAVERIRREREEKVSRADVQTAPARRVPERSFSTVAIADAEGRRKRTWRLTAEA